MALWKENAKPSPSAIPEAMDLSRYETATAEPEAPTPSQATIRPAVREKTAGESLIAPDITIEGKIEGSGHVRIAGRFKGDVNVQGDLTIERGATVNGSVRADKVIIAGELIGNIEAASHVELQQSGALTGDLKAATLTVASGSRMRGQAEFGWDDAKGVEVPRKNGAHNGAERNGSAHNGNGHGIVS